MNAMRISQLAERCGVPATTLRFYEGAGLLLPDRTPAGYRVYGDDAVERLRFINAGKHLGLPLEEIRDLLAVWTTGTCAQVKAGLRPRITARLDQAAQRDSELRTFTATLRSALGYLDALPDRAGRCDHRCGFRTVAPVARKPADCSLPGDDMASRAAAWREVLDGAVRADIAGGLRLALPAGRAAAIAELAVAEQRCCPFFDFRLHFGGPVLHLEVRVPAEASDLLATLFTAP
jgi:DNA-binding transcriptional MerR regulator